MAVDPGLLLRGMGAAVGGTVPQFRQEMQADQDRTQQQTMERQKTMFADADAALRLLEAGKLDAVIGLGQNRLNILSKIPGADPKDTQNAVQLAMRAKGGDQQALEELRADLSQTVDIGRSYGIIPTQKAPEPIKLGEGDALYDPTTFEQLANNQKPSSEKPMAPVPVEMLQGLSPEVQKKAAAAYTVAGGGNTGLTAMNGVIAAQDRAAKAEADETEALAVKDKARGVQLNAIGLASNILANPESGDVVGPLQGRGGNNWFDPENTQAIADIEELANILTAENLNLMTGVLSESDIKIIASVAGGGLDRRRDDKQFMNRVEKILFSLANAQEFTPEELSQLSTEQLMQYKRVLESQ